MAEMTVQFGSCDDEIQNQGETGIDCGGPCPSRCNNCLNDLTMGNGPSAYLYSPAQIDYVRGWALGALSEYANHWGINVFQLDTSDEYIEAIAWWVCTHMGYRGDNLNEQVLNDVAGLNYHPGDYGHGDFPEPAYYILNFSGQVRTDPSKWFFGDCEDFAILTSALLRSLGVSHQCIFNAEQPGHGFNIVNYHSKYRIFEPQSNVIGCEGYGPEFIWNDKIGAFASSDFEKVRPWQYTMNYPGCENPTVSVSGGGFGAKTLWLDWADWGEHTEVAVGDFDDDGKDDIAAVWYGGGYWPYQASVLFSTGSGFQIPSDYSRLARAVDFTPLVFRGRGSDYIVAPEGDELICVEGTPRTAPSFPGRVFTFYRPVTGMAVLGDPDGDGHAEVIELHKDAGEVYVNGDLWASGFSPGEEIPCIGDFDGDGYDDVVSFERGDWAGIRVIRAVPDEDKFTMLCLWNSEFCSGDEIPAVGDFNGDGRDDVIAFNLDNRDVFVGLSTVFGFWSNGFGSDPQARWHNDFCSDDDTPVVGDFNGDGLDDIACFRINNGRVRVWVALAMPTTLTYDYHGGNPCQQANFYLDAYWPSICP